MRKLLKIAALAVPTIAMLTLAPPAGAAEGAAAAAAGAAPTASVDAKVSATKKFCINMALGTGTRIARPMCKTKSEWADEGVDLGSRK